MFSKNLGDKPQRQVFCFSFSFDLRLATLGQQQDAGDKAHATGNNAETAGDDRDNRNRSMLDLLHGSFLSSAG